MIISPQQVRGKYRVIRTESGFPSLKIKNEISQLSQVKLVSKQTSTGTRCENISDYFNSPQNWLRG